MCQQLFQHMPHSGQLSTANEESDSPQDRDKPQVHGINDFIAMDAYFECTWLGGQFVPAKWNMYSEEGPRTNSHLEGWHSKVKKIAGKNHLNIFEMVELFKSRNKVVDGRRDQKE